MSAPFDFFSSEAFMPHGHCYLWRPGVLWLQVITNAAIGVAYVAIAFTLAVLVRRGDYLPFKGMALAFGVFIISCGMTHFFDVYVIWQPAYWVDGGVRAVTAIASVGTAIMLPGLVPEAVALARGAKAAREKGVKLEAAVEQLGSLYEKAKELDLLKTQFFANVSHELRTPLALILTPAEKLHAAENLTNEQRRDLETIVRNGRTLLKHVNDLLDVSRLEAGRHELRYTHVDVARLIRLVAGHFDVLTEERHVSLKLELPERLEAEIDAEKLERVILNLLSNAFKFTPAPGVVRVSLRDDNEEVVIEVADSGPGVDPAAREIVFERFRQADQTTTRAFGGTGLGLAICKDFVELHGGRISVGEAPEGGAVFRVVLPLAPLSATQRGSTFELGPRRIEDDARQVVEELRQRVEREAEPAATQGLQRPRALVVEDNPEMSRFVSEILQEQFSVDRAVDGKEALERALAHPPDVVVTDIMMPRMSGDELVREMRARKELRDVPIVILTAKADDQLRVDLLRDGAQDYLIKPFSAPELLTRVQNLATIKRARDTLQRELDTQMEDLTRLAEEAGQRKRQLQLTLESMRVAREQAEKASKVKTNFLRLVSHELRTPLTALQLQLERMRLEEDRPRPIVERMATSTGRLRDLIEGLLQYARIESGRLTTCVERVDLADVSAEALEEARPEAERRGLQLVFERSPDLGPLATDRELVRLVISNLLGNALKFTTAGEIRVSTRRVDDGHALSVRDSGPGIPPEARARIFEPFEQGEPTQSKHTPGVGLGLALVREMVTALGGRILVDTEVGRGSTFTVILPSLEGQAGASS